MAFDYSKSGLPDNIRWDTAAQFCEEWLRENMGHFGPARIESFMNNQPVAAAKLLLAHCDDVSEELVVMALLGPAKEKIYALEEDAATDIFGDRWVSLMQHLMGEIPGDADIRRDAVRIFLVEGLSTMNDQLIGRAKIDKHHRTRWRILEGLEYNFSAVKGQNPRLDTVFEAALVKSRAALEALDVQKAQGKPKTPPRKPGL